jgi:hypothetical protein
MDILRLKMDILRLKIDILRLKMDILRLKLDVFLLLNLKLLFFLQIIVLFVFGDYFCYCFTKFRDYKNSD